MGIKPLIDIDLIKQCDKDALHIEAVELELPGFAEIELKYAADYLNETHIHSSDTDRAIFRRIQASPLFTDTIRGLDSIGVQWLAHALIEAEARRYAGFLGLVRSWEILDETFENLGANG